MVHNIRKRVRLSLVSLAWNVLHLMKTFFKFYRALAEQSIFFPQFTGERVSFMRITCGLDLIKRGGGWSASPLTWFLSLVDVFSFLKNIRKIKSMTLSL